MVFALFLLDMFKENIYTQSTTASNKKWYVIGKIIENGKDFQLLANTVK